MRYYYLLLITFFPFLSNAQNAYYTIDTTSHVGVNVIEGTDYQNSHFCLVEQNGYELKFSPDEVKEYRLKNGRTYISKEVTIGDTTKQVFLERITSADIIVFYYKGRNSKFYFLESLDGELIILDKDDASKNFYKKIILDRIGDCEYASKNAKYMKFTSNGINKFIDLYSDCKPFSYPRFKFGAYYGIDYAKYVTRESIYSETKKLDFHFHLNYSIGAFLDIPISSSQFYLHNAISFTEHDYTLNMVKRNGKFDMMVKSRTFRVPINLKYVIPGKNFNAFIKGGLIYNYNYSSEVEIYDTNYFPGDIVEVKKLINDDLVSDNEIGLTIGLGVLYKITNKYAVFVQTGASQTLGFGNTGNHNNSILDLSLGVML